MFRKIIVGGALAAASVFATGAQAHPKMLSASPEANATVQHIKSIEIRFSEKLVNQFSGVELAMTDMPGMKMSTPMKMAGIKTMIASDGKSLMVMLAKPLPTGTYKLTYHVVSADTHRVQGGYTFKVK